jgi:uncharacterized membrane protein YdjX (TVP38/TMEM64 family)
VQEQLFRFLNEHAQWAVAISLLVSIAVAVAGVLPSVFITGANILFFGFWSGTALSFAGEAIGAAIAFLLYRKGFRKGGKSLLERFPGANRLIGATGMEAFTLIFSLRLLPFVPSGVVTFAAAIGRISMFSFFIASSLGKVPSLLIEAYAVYQVSQKGWQGTLVLTVVAVFFLFFIIKKITHKGKSGNAGIL